MTPHLCNPPQMLFLLRTLFWILALHFFPRSRATLQLEIEALRHQVAVLHRNNPTRPRLNAWDRSLWVLLRSTLPSWKQALVIVKPETVVGWHRKGFRLLWRFKCRQKKAGRPLIPLETRELIRKISRENPNWGVPRIQGELKMLGIKVSDATVRKYRVRVAKPSSQSWKTFLANHSKEIRAVDFFVLPTFRFKLLFCFVVLSHDRRKILHTAVTTHPTAQWTAQQVTEAFPWDTAPTYLLRDNDKIYGEVYRKRLDSMGIQDKKTALRSPWQNPYVERVIGSIRRECFNHIIPINERHARQVLKEYAIYYNESRTHLSLNKDSPEGRRKQTPYNGNVISIPVLGGLHHLYERHAA